MAQKLDESRKGFLDLPPEIRNVIYEYCLVVNGGITIEDCGRMRPTDERYGDLNKLGLTAKLLRTCRFINTEATPILYGSNRFTFWDHFCKLSPGGIYFLKLRGSNIKYLRQVEIRAPQKFLISCLTILKKCTALDEVSITGWGHSSPEIVAKLIGPFCRHLHRKRKGTDKKQALEVVRLDDGEKYEVDWKDKREQVMAIIEATLK